MSKLLGGEVSGQGRRSVMEGAGGHRVLLEVHTLGAASFPNVWPKVLKVYGPGTQPVTGVVHTKWNGKNVAKRVVGSMEPPGMQKKRALRCTQVISRVVSRGAAYRSDNAQGTLRPREAGAALAANPPDVAQLPVATRQPG